WKHRNVKLDDEKAWDILARFDDGAPAMISQSLGKGRVWIFCSGWQPNQSQLALSSKFVPIIASLFRFAAPENNESDNHHVGDSITISVEDQLTDPDGKKLDLNHGTVLLEQPGIYHRQFSEGAQTRFAVNLAESESLTTVADVERLERLGVGMKDERPVGHKEASQRQLRAVELEAQQGWWRWLVIGVLGAIGVESLLCIARNKLA
ncbi:MAG: hypothetical protein ABL921_32300, partial [Pirellula sp.]